MCEDENIIVIFNNVSEQVSRKRFASLMPFVRTDMAAWNEFDVSIDDYVLFEGPDREQKTRIFMRCIFCTPNDEDIDVEPTFMDLLCFSKFADMYDLKLDVNTKNAILEEPLIRLLALAYMNGDPWLIEYCKSSISIANVSVFSKSWSSRGWKLVAAEMEKRLSMRVIYKDDHLHVRLCDQYAIDLDVLLLPFMFPMDAIKISKLPGDRDIKYKLGYEGRYYLGEALKILPTQYHNGERIDVADLLIECDN